MKSRILYSLPAFVLAAVVVAYTSLPCKICPASLFGASTLQAAVPVPVDSAKNGAQIDIKEDNFDFHDIEQGTKAEHDFEIFNTGTDTLVILGTHPSCGCTAAIMDQSRIAPGTKSRLHVTFDANGKPEGPIVKSVTITSNSKEKSDAMVRIQGRVVKSKLAHKTTMHLDGMFQGDCAKCHVDKGKGELGARLYEADCALCHGTKADGKPGPELASEAMMKHTPKQWKTIIENGVNNTAMPAFHTKNKGPLGDEEIASLVEYFGAFKKEMERNNELKKLSPATGAVTNAPATPASKTATVATSTKSMKK
jgi:mono/diheme cytochrome c family protein